MDRDLALIQLQSKNMALGLILTFLLGGFGLFYIGFIWGLIGSITMVLLMAVSFYETVVSHLPASVLSYIPDSIMLSIPGYLDDMESLQPVMPFIALVFYVLFLVLTAVSINSYNKQLLRKAINK